MSRGRKLSDDEVAELAELRARNLEELQALKEDMAQRAKVVRLSDHRKPEPEVKTVTTFSDHQIKQMVEETRRQLDDYRGFMSELLTQLIGSVQADIKKAIRKVRAEVDAARTDAAEAKAIASGGVAVIRKQDRSA